MYPYPPLFLLNRFYIMIYFKEKVEGIRKKWRVWV